MRLIFPEFKSGVAIKVLTIILCRNNNIIFNGDDDNFQDDFMAIYLPLNAYDFVQ